MSSNCYFILFIYLFSLLFSSLYIYVILYIYIYIYNIYLILIYIYNIYPVYNIKLKEKIFVQIGTSDKVTFTDHFNKKISKNSTNMANSNCRFLIYKIKF